MILATNADFSPKLWDGNCGFVRELTVNGKTHEKHLEVAKQGVDAFCKKNALQVQSGHLTQDQLHRVPERLIRDILAAAREEEEEV